MSLLILAMFQDQASAASKHLLVETKDKKLADPPVVKKRKADAKLPGRGQTEHGTDYGETEYKIMADPPVVHPKADEKLQTGADYFMPNLWCLWWGQDCNKRHG